MNELGESEGIEELVRFYRPTGETVELVRKMRLVFLVGITGAGKDSIEEVLLKASDYKKIVTYTMREPRMNRGVMEQNGVDYHFINEDEALRMLKAKEFVEVKFVHGHVYGTGVNELKQVYEAGKIGLANVDVQGATEYRDISEGIKAFFVLPPSYGVWRERLLGRYDGLVDGVDLTERTQSAIRELELAMKCDFLQSLVNDDLEESACKVDGVVYGRDDDAILEDTRRGKEIMSDLWRRIRLGPQGY